MLVAADGSFETGALPTTSSADYAVSLIPPAGTLLHEEQPTANEPFALVAGAASPTEITIDRSFALTSESGDDPASAPTMPDVPGDGIVNVGDASTLNEAFLNSSDEELAALLDELESEIGAIVVMSSYNRLLGIIEQVTPRTLSYDQLSSMQEEIVEDADGISYPPNSRFVANLGNSVHNLTNSRTRAEDADYAVEIGHMIGRDASIGQLRTAFDALNTYQADPTTGHYAAALAAVASTSHGEGPTLKPLPEATAGSSEAARLARERMSEARMQLEAELAAQRDTIERLREVADHQRVERMLGHVRDLQETRTPIVGNMRSTPIDLGTIRWNAGTVTGTLDTSAVPAGDHHLFLEFEDPGLIFVSSVTIDRSAPTPPLRVETGQEGALSAPAQ